MSFSSPQLVNLFNLDFFNVTLDEMIEVLARDVQLNRRVLVQTVNVDHIVLIKEDQQFCDFVSSADYITCDGMPILWSSKLTRRPLKSRVTGADLAVSLCATSFHNDFRIYFFGAKPGVAARAKEHVLTLFPNAQIVGYYSPSSDEIMDPTESRRMCHGINQTGANVLLLALGTPKQEKWYQRYKNILEPNVTIGVGAAIDFLAGEQMRAPLIVQQIGLEWFYRLTQDPHRLWKRYLWRDMLFIPIFLKFLIRRL